MSLARLAFSPARPVANQLRVTTHIQVVLKFNVNASEGEASWQRPSGFVPSDPLLEVLKRSVINPEQAPAITPFFHLRAGRRPPWPRDKSGRHVQSFQWRSPASPPFPMQAWSQSVSPSQAVTRSCFTSPAPGAKLPCNGTEMGIRFLKRVNVCCFMLTPASAGGRPPMLTTSPSAINLACA